MVQVVPTYDHTIPYMDYTGPISTEYGRGTVLKGRRAQAEVYHADPADEPGTKVRFNLYDGPAPEEYSIRRDKENRWFLHNKTQTRLRRPDLPSSKPEYGEVRLDEIDPSDTRQAMMPKLDGAHAIIDLKAGRSPRVFSYRVGKKSGTGLIEHTHKMPELLKKKVPKELDGTMLRGELLGVTGEGRSIPAERIGGLLNSKVWESRMRQAAQGVKLQAFPFSVVKYKGRTMEDAPFEEKLKVLREVESKLDELVIPEIAATADEKINLLNAIADKSHPLTEEGVVLVNRNEPGRPIKAKHAPDFDVFVRAVHQAKKKGGGLHDRVGAVGYSWTPGGRIVGQVGGFRHDEARDMWENPDDYIGRVAKVKATKVFKDNKGNPGALFQPRFKEWHLDKGDIEKSAYLGPVGKGTVIGGGIGATLGAMAGYHSDVPVNRKKPTTGQRVGRAVTTGLSLGLSGALLGHEIGLLVEIARGARYAGRAGAGAGAGYRSSYSSSGAGAGAGFGFGSGGRLRPDWLKDVTTKADAKSKFRDMAMKTHPDRGGDAEKFKVINNEWEAFKNSHLWEKLAHLLGKEKIASLSPEVVMKAAFLNELEKIASLEGLVLGQLLKQKVMPPVSSAVRDLEDQARARWDQLGRGSTYSL